MFTQDVRNVYKILTENPERKRTFRRLSCRWEDNIIMDLTDGAI
jgi:hypothetical protein